MQRCGGRVPGPAGPSQTGYWYLTRLLVVVVLLLLVAPVSRAHPQCLDFKPPFRPLRELEFCVMYKEFGCCDYQKDQDLMTKYYSVMDNFDYYGYANCASFVQELLCQVGTQGQRSAWVATV